MLRRWGSTAITGAGRRGRPMGILSVVPARLGGTIPAVLLVVAVRGLTGLGRESGIVPGPVPTVGRAAAARRTVELLVRGRAEPRVHRGRAVPGSTAAWDVVERLPVGSQVLDLPDGLCCCRDLLGCVLLLRP